MATEIGRVEPMDTGRSQQEDDGLAEEETITKFTMAAEELETEWNKGKNDRDLNRIDQLLGEAKILLAKLDAFLPKDGSRIQELIHIRTILEIGAFYCLEKPEPDIEQFVRFSSQLKHYYLDYNGLLQESPKKFELFCAKLLWLLTENRIAEFHTELALVLYPSNQVKAIQRQNPILFKTMKIAESLEDGRYNSFYRQTIVNNSSSKEQCLAKRGEDALHASDICEYFLNKLIISCRPDIAETFEKSYDRWSKTFAMERLQINTNAEFQAFAQKRRWATKDGQYYTYDSGNNLERIPSSVIISQNLVYAKELEQII